MSRSAHLNILDSGFIKLIEYGDQLNRQLGVFLKTLSNFFAGAILVVLLIPIAILFILATTVIARISFEYLVFELKREIGKIPKEDERTLMENHLEIERINSFMQSMRSSLINGSKSKRFYFTIFFGGSLSRFMNYSTRLQKEIEAQVYPNLHSELESDQIQRLVKEYEGLPVED